MQIDRRLVGFGLFLIAVGGVMAAVRQGLVSESAARQAWTLWPLLLVAGGLSIVLSGRPGASLGGLIVAVTAGLMIGGIAATGALPGPGFCGGAGRTAGSAFPERGGDLGTGARVTITQDCGDLTVGTVAGSTWSLAGASRDGRAPEVEESGSRLAITSLDGGPFGLGGSAWTVAVPRDSSLSLEMTVNGGESRLSLGGAHLSSLSIDANAASADLDLRDAAALGDVAIDLNFGSATIRLPALSLTTTLTVNAGSAALCLPPGAGVRIRLDSVAASNDFAGHGLIETGGGWETPGFASAAVQLDVRADINAGSIALDPARTCAG